jgi:hypothetical protein
MGAMALDVDAGDRRHLALGQVRAVQKPTVVVRGTPFVSKALRPSSSPLAVLDRPGSCVIAGSMSLVR